MYGAARCNPASARMARFDRVKLMRLQAAGIGASAHPKFACLPVMLMPRERGPLGACPASTSGAGLAMETTREGCW